MTDRACLCPDQLFEAAFSKEEYEQLEVFSLGEEAGYPMEFGWASDSCQWKVISEFIGLRKRSGPMNLILHRTPGHSLNQRIERHFLSIHKAEYPYPLQVAG